MIPELDAQTNAAKLLIRFSMEPLPDPVETAKAGHPKFRDAEFIEIRVPGQRDIIKREVRPSDLQQYPAQYAAWKANAASGGEIGLPLREWPGVTKAQVAELEYFGCRTVEQLAGMSDASLRNVGPILDLRRKAQKYLEAAAGNAPLEKMHAELRARDNEIDTLKKQMAALIEAQSKADKGKQANR